MSLKPTAFTSGITTRFPKQEPMKSFPDLPTHYQVVRSEDFIPYRSGDYTATTGGAGAGAGNFSVNGGAISLTSGSTTSFKSELSLNEAAFQFIPGNGLWHNCKVGVPVLSAQSNPMTDANLYIGLFDNADPTAASNGVYFLKPSGGTAFHFVILKGGTATTFQNVGDFQYPSGLYGDTTSVNGVLSFNGTGTTFTTVLLNTAGSGYRYSPLVNATGTAGSGAKIVVQTGSAAGNPASGQQLDGTSLYAAFITAAGSGYTAGTLGADIIPWIDLQFHYSSKDRLIVGVNGNAVLAIDASSPNTATTGSTYNVATTFNSFNFNGTTLSSTSYTVQPKPGGAYVALPQVPLNFDMGLVGTTANNRIVYVAEYNLATEVN